MLDVRTMKKHPSIDSKKVPEYFGKPYDFCVTNNIFEEEEEDKKM